MYFRINCNIFSYDYSGYGVSGGKPSEKNLYADIEVSLSNTKENADLFNFVNIFNLLWWFSISYLNIISGCVARDADEVGD